MIHGLIHHLGYLKLCSTIIILISRFSDLHADTNSIQPTPLIDRSDTDILSPPSLLVLSKYVSTSDGLFFIHYTPEDTFK